MGLGFHEEEPKEASEDEREAEQRRLNENPQEEIELQKVDVTRPRPTPRVLVLGESKPMFKTSYLKYALLGFNCLLAILGLIILILAVWIRADPQFNIFETSVDISKFSLVSHLLITAGVIIVLFGFLGCFGVLLESQWMLFTYFTIFILMFILQVAAVVLVFSAPYSHTIKEQLQVQMKNKIRTSKDSDDARYFLDVIQERLECCGSIDQNDYTYELPRSCRNPKDGIVHEQGCGIALLNYLRSKAVLIGGFTIPMLLIQLLAKIMCGCLIYNIREESRYKME